MKTFLNTVESQRLSLRIVLISASGAARFRYISVFPANYTDKVINVAANEEEVPARRQEQNLEVIVREVLNHPSFHTALRSNQSPALSLGQSESPRPSESPSNSSSTGASTAPTPRTPRQELQQLFFRGRANSLLQFQQRVNRGPRSRATTSPYNRRGSTATVERKGKGNGKGKRMTFHCEVVLLRSPSDNLVRGREKASLQRMGHVINSFEFNKCWSAEELINRLRQAFCAQLARLTSSTTSSDTNSVRLVL